MKRLFLILALLTLGTGLSAQKPRSADFRVACDSLQQRLLRRTGVTSLFKVDKALVRGNKADLYFSQNLSAFPWREADLDWFRKQVEMLGKQALRGYALGNLYVGGQPMEELPMPAPGKSGAPLKTVYRTDDPRTRKALVRGNDWWPQGLSGRHIALWQSHGHYWEEESDCWKWQRTPNHRTTEDLFTQSFVLPFLMPMLENAGAVVLCPRERDPQTREMVCDNDEAFSGHRAEGVRLKGHYSEKGSWADAGTGFADAKETYLYGENPFTMGTARKTATVTDATRKDVATATWRPDIPAKGDYAVYVSYKTFSNSTSDARYTVRHLGGETLLHVNQQMAGGTWVYLGTFPFDKGKGGCVILSAHSSAAGVVSADAVRFGGGMGKVERGGEISGKPAYLEGALYSMQYAGIDSTLFKDWRGDYTRDYAGRGAWVQEMVRRNVPVDLSLAWHTDAGVTPNDSIVGTLAIYTRTNKRETVFPNGEERMSSRLYCDLVQTQVVDDIRALYEPEWMRRQLWDRSYSESRTPDVPALLLELLSHLNFADMRYGMDPSFRFTAARSVYKGILKYLSARYGCTYAVQPLPVQNFRVKLQDGKAVLSWQDTEDPLEPTAKPAYYKVYTRQDAAAFDVGYQVNECSVTLPLEEGKLYSFKVTACNQGGEGFPSEILCAGYPSADAKKVLVVNNFTRISAPAWVDTPQYAGFLDDLDSGVPWGRDLLFAGPVNQFDRTRSWTDDDNPGFGGCYTDCAGSIIAGNTFDFAAVHGAAILKAGYAVESSSVAAFDGASDAWVLDLVCGKQLTTRIGRGAVPDRYTVFPETLQSALRSYTARGGNVLLSGSYIGTDAWDSVYQGVSKAPDSTRAFVKEVLGYEWVTNFGDHGGRVVGARGSGLPSVRYNREWSEEIYRVENPDGIRPAGEKTTLLMRYRSNKIPAATFYDAGTWRVAAFGFPLETTTSMDALLKATLKKF